MTNIKPEAKKWTIKEQIITDLATGLTFQFEVNELTPECPFRLTIYGDQLPFGNREILFSTDGEECGSGTATRGLCRPGWLINPNDL